MVRGLTSSQNFSDSNWFFFWWTASQKWIDCPLTCLITLYKQPFSQKHPKGDLQTMPYLMIRLIHIHMKKLCLRIKKNSFSRWQQNILIWHIHVHVFINLRHLILNISWPYVLLDYFWWFMKPLTIPYNRYTVYCFKFTTHFKLALTCCKPIWHCWVICSRLPRLSCEEKKTQIDSKHILQYN